MLLYHWVCLNNPDVCRLHHNDRNVLGVHSRELVCWSCGTAHALHLCRRIFCACWCYNKLRGDGRIMYAVYNRERLRRGCRGPCRVRDRRVLVSWWVVISDGHAVRRRFLRYLNWRQRIFELKLRRFLQQHRGVLLCTWQHNVDRRGVRNGVLLPLHGCRTSGVSTRDVWEHVGRLVRGVQRLV